jgi:hypothetical protein
MIIAPTHSGICSIRLIAYERTLEVAVTYPADTEALRMHVRYKRYPLPLLRTNFTNAFSQLRDRGC